MFQLKEIDVKTRSCHTLMGTGKAGNVVSSDLEQVQFNEPGGLAISGEGRWLYIADTNNHAIKKYDFREKRLSEVSLQCATRIVFSADTPLLCLKLWQPC